MTNTIELLETIGRDASLRHASGESLSHALNGMHASEALKQAAISGDGSHLQQELGHGGMKDPNHVSNNVGGGQDEDLDIDHGDSPHTERDESDKDAEDLG